MMQIPSYSRLRRHWRKSATRSMQNDKAVVEADLNALKEAINKVWIDQMTDAQG